MTMTTEARDTGPPRLPAQPLFDRIANDVGRPRGGLKLVARVAGVNPRTVKKWRDRGLTIWHADRLCVEVVGCLPGEVWGTRWYRALSHGLGRHYDPDTKAWVDGQT